MRVFEVYEIEWPSLFCKGPSAGLFSNFGAAEAFTKSMFTPDYDRHMLIVEITMLDTWPQAWETVGHNNLTYYSQVDGQMVRTVHG